VAQAQTRAQQAAEVAAVGTQGAGQPLPWGGGPGQAAKFDLGQELVNQLNAAREDAFAHADDQWDVAREQGFTTTPIRDVSQLYAKLEGECQRTSD
jgi:hypothetical protein